MRGVALGAYDAPDAEGEAASRWPWVVDRLAEFEALGTDIYAQAHRASVIAASAKADGDLTTYGEARKAVRRIMSLWSFQQTLSAKAARIRATVQGLGVFPWLVAGLTAAGVVALATGMAFVFARFGAERRIVDLLATGSLSPGEAERLLGETEGGFGGGLMGGVTQVALLAIVGLLVWQLGK